MLPSRALSRTRMFAVVVLVPLIGAMLPSTVLVAAPLPTTSRSTSPQSLVLHARDLPAVFGSGFSESGSPITNSEVAVIEHVTTGTIDRHGRLGGYSTTLAKQKGKGGIY